MKKKEAKKTAPSHGRKHVHKRPVSPAQQMDPNPVNPLTHVVPKPG